MQHRTRLVWLGFATLALSSAVDCKCSRTGGASLAPPVEPPPLTQAAAPELAKAAGEEQPADQMTASVRTCESPGCPIVVEFNYPVVDPAGFAKAAIPAVTLEPTQRGTWSWTAADKLTFTPAEAAMSYGTYVSVHVPQLAAFARTDLQMAEAQSLDVQVPFLQAVGKVARWPVVPGQPRFVGFLNGFSGEIGQGPLFLFYDQKVAPKQIKNNLKVTTGEGEPLKASVTTPDSTAQVYEGDIPNDYFITVKIAKLPNENSSVSLEVPSWIDGQKTTDNFTLNVVKTFDLVRHMVSENPMGGEGEGGEGEQQASEGPYSTNPTLVFDFNRAYSLPLIKKALTVTPAAKSVEVSGWNTTCHVALQLEVGTRYHVRLDKTLVDLVGNPLADRVEFDFRTRDLPPLVQLPALPSLVEAGESLLPLRLQNVEAIKVHKTRFESGAAFVRALTQEPQKSCAGYSSKGRSTDLTAITAFAHLNHLDTAEIKVGNDTGLYCVEVETTGRGTEAKGTVSAAALVQVSDLGITSKVYAGEVFSWVTRLAKAEALGAAKVALVDDSGQELAKGSTDASGAVTIAAKGLTNATGVEKPVFVVVESGSDTAVLELNNETLSSAWQFGMHGPTAGASPLYAAVFTERGVYRPGDTVHLKIIVGKDNDKRPAKVTAQIQDSRGQQVVEKELNLDALGGASLDLNLTKEANVGEYTINVSSGALLAVRKFKVEEYRVPTFTTSVASGAWKLGHKARATVTAKYMHGGAMGGRQVKWEVRREAETFAPAGFPQFVFNIPRAVPPVGALTSGDGYLDDKGTREIELLPDHPSLVGPMRYIVEATVTDLDRQAYAGRLSRVVHPAAFYVGLRPPPRAIAAAGQTLEVPIAAASPEGNPVAGVQVRAVLERVDHHTTARLAGAGDVQVTNREVQVSRDECLVTTTEATVLCHFKLTEAGQFRVRAWAQDLEHQVVQAGFELVVSGDNTTAWPRFDQDRVDVIADKSSYAPGETAKLVVQTPFDTALALVTLEQGTVLEHRLVKIAQNTPAIEVPITAAMAPNVFVSVVLVRGRIHAEKDATGFETGAPGFKIGYADLKVDPTPKRLTVTVAPQFETTTPGSKLKVSLEAKDNAGKALAGGSATLWVVDEAVLGLTGYRTPDPVAQIYAERVLGIRTGENRLELPNAKRARREQLFPGGDGGPEAPQFADLAMDLRKLFKTTAYWNPTLTLDSQGKATVEVELPDNITTYRIMTVVADQAACVGSAENKVVVKQPLIVQPMLPRFVYPDDELEVGALAYNSTDRAAEVMLATELVGMKLAHGDAGGKLMVEPGKNGIFHFAVKVNGRDQVTVRFAAKMGEHKDSVEIKLPVLQPGNKRSLVVSKSTSGTESLSLTIPAERIAGTVKMEVVASTTSLTELKDSVQYLMDYPNGCIEQTTSTAYPLVVLKDLLPEIGITVNMDDLKKFSEAGVKRIMSFQTEGGGLSYWPGGTEPHAFATAFGLTALIEAQKRGYDVPKASLDRMADFLELTLKKPEIKEEICHGAVADPDSRALFVMTLGRLGRPQAATISRLWADKSRLTAFGLSFLGIAASEMPGDKSLVAPILEEVRRAAKVEAEQAWYEGEPKGGYSFDSPLRTHASALLAYASGETSSAMTGKLLTGLLARQQGGLWGNTQENVFGIMGIYTLAGGKEGGVSPNMDLSVNGKNIGEAVMEKVSRRVRRLSLGESQLGLAAGKDATPTVTLANHGGAPIILTLRAQYDVPLTGDNRKAVSHGCKMERHYESMKGDSLEGEKIALGSLVRVRLKLSCDKKLNYVAIDDKLPAGLEPLNANLETTEKVSQGQVTDEIARSQSLLSFSEMRDHRVAFYVDEMPIGGYEYDYAARATTAGTFLRPAARTEAMYAPDVFGTTSIDNVTIR